MSASVIWFPTKVAVFERDSWTCLACGRGPGEPEKYSELTGDHVKPRSLGGTSVPVNLVTLCLSCNSSRQARPLVKWQPGLVQLVKDQCAIPVDMAKAKALVLIWKPEIYVRQRVRNVRVTAKRREERAQRAASPF